jgi:hypothetical protein
MRYAVPAFATLALAALPASSLAGLWDLLRSHRDLEVITVTDVSATGNLVAPATPDQPQYYIAASLGFRDLGGVMGGISEPPTSEVLRLISAELAKQGYRPATTRSAPPSLLLVYTWGTLNAEESFNGNPDLPPVQRNHGQIVRFLGGRKVGISDDYFNPLLQPMLGLQVYNYQARTLLEVAREDFYVIVVSAYDLEAALQKKRRPPLWTTRIAAPSLGFRMADVVPAMLAIGGQQFGRETPRPVWVNASDKFKPNVTLGELQLLEYLGSDPLPVTDASHMVKARR